MNPNQPQPEPYPNHNSGSSPNQQPATNFDPTFVPAEFVQNPVDQPHYKPIPPEPLAPRTPDQYQPETPSTATLQQDQFTQPTSQLPPIDPAYSAGLPQINPIGGKPGSGSQSNTLIAGMDSFKASRRSRVNTRGLVKVLIALITVVTLCLIAWFIFSRLTSSDTNGSNSSTNQPENQQAVGPSESRSPVEASKIIDMAASCNGSAIKNAAKYNKSATSPILLFEQASESEYIVSSIEVTPPNRGLNADNYLAAQRIGCLDRKSIADTGIECQFQDSGTTNTRTLSLYDVVYEFRIIEATTGKQLSSAEVKVISTKCPLEATFSKSDPKLYSPVDQTQVNKLIQNQGETS